MSVENGEAMLICKTTRTNGAKIRTYLKNLPVDGCLYVDGAIWVRESETSFRKKTYLQGVWREGFSVEVGQLQDFFSLSNTHYYSAEIPNHFLHNLSMQTGLERGETIDLLTIGREIEPGLYEIDLQKCPIDTFSQGLDFCDSSKEKWVYSVGKNLASSKVYASTDSRFYCNPEYECLWLR